MPAVIHVVWSPATGPIAAYSLEAQAIAHARGLTGMAVDSCELRETIATEVTEAIDDWNGDSDEDDTPVIGPFDHRDPSRRK